VPYIFPVAQFRLIVAGFLGLPFLLLPFYTTFITVAAVFTANNKNYVMMQKLASRNGLMF